MTSTLSLETKFWKTKSTEVLQGNLAMGRDALVKIFIKKKKLFQCELPHHNQRICAFES